MRAGIYCIHNIITDQRYIGQSINVDSRLRAHKRELAKNRHRNKHLQASFLAYGEASFSFYTLEETPPFQKTKEDIDNLNWLEKFYISSYESTDRKRGFNKSTGGTKDHIYVEMSKGNSFKLKNLVTGEETITDNLMEFCRLYSLNQGSMYEISKGKRHVYKNWTVTERNGFVVEHINKNHSLEANAKFSLKMKGRKQSIIHIQKRSRSKSKKYLVTSPEGISFCVIGLPTFCKENNLDFSNMAKVAKGIWKQSKGWKCKLIADHHEYFVP